MWERGCPIVEQSARAAQICRIVSTLSGVNTVFVGNHGTLSAEYVNVAVPDLLKPYLKSVETAYLPRTDKLGKENTDMGTVWRQSGTHQLSFLLVPTGIDKPDRGRIVVGPFLTRTPDSGFIQLVMREVGLPMPLWNIVKQYYQSIPVLNDCQVEALAGCVVGLAAGLTGEPVDLPHIRAVGEPQTETPDLSTNFLKNRELYADVVERRYEAENRIMAAVEQGDYPAVEKIFGQDGFLFQFADRIPHDPLRSHKNISFVFNTLYRKAAEYGGVPRIDLDGISEKYAIRIEGAGTLQQVAAVQREMRREYCELVQRFSLRRYSGFVRRIVEYIRLNFDGDLSVAALSHLTGVSASRVIKRFHNETGETLGAFISSQRIAEAVRLMRDPSYSLSEIAMAVGFNDGGYFTKVFKKCKGMTPSTFRKNMHLA